MMKRMKHGRLTLMRGKFEGEVRLMRASELNFHCGGGYSASDHEGTCSASGSVRQTCFFDDVKASGVAFGLPLLR